jgi:non-ribosomal peptide synthetase component F
MTVSGRREVTVAELVHERAAMTPEAVAVVDAGYHSPSDTPFGCPRPPYGGRSLSYRELSSRAVQLANRLRRSGVGQGAVVAVYARRSPELVIGLLGVLTCGAGYLPLDPDDPLDRTTSLLSGLKPALVLAQPELAPRVRRLGDLVEIRVEDLPTSRGPCPDEPPVSASSTRLGDLAYLGYPSARKGPVLGVEIEHHSLLSLVTALGTEFGGGPDDAWLLITGPTCAASLPTLLLPLVVGARLVLADHAVATDGEALLDVVHKFQISHLPAPSRVWRMLLDAGLPESDLVALVLGSEIDRVLAREVRQRVRRMSTMSGSLETTIWSLTYPLPTDPDVVPMGRPMINSRIHLLDQCFRPVPAGSPGEMYIGGSCVARGYHDRPDLTAQRFLSDPEQPAVGRLFRTRQLARWRDSHRLEYVGPAVADS